MTEPLTVVEYNYTRKPSAEPVTVDAVETSETVRVTLDVPRHVWETLVSHIDPASTYADNFTQAYVRALGELPFGFRK